MAPRARIEIGATGKLPRDGRIRRRGDFTRLHRNGLRIHTSSFSLVVDWNPWGSSPRFGCAINRRVGGAVVRNRIRRLLKEMFRRCSTSLPAADFLFIAKPSAAVFAKEGFDALTGELLPALERSVRALEARGPRAPVSEGAAIDDNGNLG